MCEDALHDPFKAVDDLTANKSPGSVNRTADCYHNGILDCTCLVVDLGRDAVRISYGFPRADYRLGGFREDDWSLHAEQQWRQLLVSNLLTLMLLSA